MSLHLTFKVSGSNNFDLDVPSDATVHSVKELCVEKSGIDKDQQKIIFKGLNISTYSHFLAPFRPNSKG